MSKQRTITLSDGPVRIIEPRWPLIAQSDWSNWPTSSVSPLAKAQIRVRESAAGNGVLVYGTFAYGEQALPFRERQPGAKPGGIYRAGFKVENDVRSAEVVDAIWLTADHLAEYEMPENLDQPDWMALADECIGNLPVVTL
jgi:hypothetical protein